MEVCHRYYTGREVLEWSGNLTLIMSQKNEIPVKQKKNFSAIAQLFYEVLRSMKKSIKCVWSNRNHLCKQGKMYFKYIFCRSDLN